MGYSKRILIVDDDPNVVSALGRLLRRLPVEVAGATRPEAALALARTRSFDLILADYRMPEMDGVQMLTRLRELQPNAWRYMISAYGDRATILAAVNAAGVHRFLAKPWQDDALVGMIRRELRLEEPAPQPGVHSVLIVDPSPNVTLRLARVFRSRGWDAVGAPSTDAALTELFARPVGLVITEWRGTEVDGWTLLRCIRSDARLRHLPVVVLTNRADPDEATRAYALGAQEVLAKPFSEIEVVQKILGPVESTE